MDRQRPRECFRDDATARFLLHDGDATFDAAFGRTAEAFGLTSIVAARVRGSTIATNGSHLNRTASLGLRREPDVDVCYPPGPWYLPNAFDSLRADG